MLNFKSIIYSAFVAGCLTAPLIPNDRVSMSLSDFETLMREVREVRELRRFAQEPPAEKQDPVFLLLVLLGGLLASLTLLAVLYCLCRFPKWRRHNTTCGQYTTARDADNEKVYRQLRLKWKAHEKEKDEHLNNSVLPATLFLDDNKINNIKEVMNNVHYYNTLCSTYFPTKEYEGDLVPSTTDFTVHYAKESAAIESLAVAVKEMKSLLPLPSATWTVG